MTSGIGDALQTPERLRQKAAEAKKVAALTTDLVVAAELMQLAEAYLRDAARLERLARRNSS